MKELYKAQKQVLSGDLMALVVASKVKEAIKKHKMNTASDLLPALEKRILWEIDEAARRATTNGRKTVRAGDL